MWKQRSICREVEHSVDTHRMAKRAELVIEAKRMVKKPTIMDILLRESQRN
jgi:hypothetical protein